MLSIGAYYDLKTREVNDRLWMVFGGADAKALVVSVILPVYYSPSSFYVHLLTGIMVLTNAVLFALVVPLCNALSNLVRVARGERIFEGFDEPAWKKILACFVGTPNKHIHHHSVMECSVDEGKKRFSFRLNYDDDGGGSDRSCYSGAPTNDRIWVSQNLPFLVFMLAGFLAVMFSGDLLLLMLRHQ